MGRSVIKASPEPELEMVRGACTGRPRTWGFQPYNALAKELNFGNEQPMECGGLSQAKFALLFAFRAISRQSVPLRSIG